MSEILRLILPFFGVLFLGYGAGRLRRVSEDGLAGLTFFVTYLAMPALFFRLVAETPLAHAGGWSFVLDHDVFDLLRLRHRLFGRRADQWRPDHPGRPSRGWSAPIPTSPCWRRRSSLPAFGAAAALPMALIFSFDNALVVATAPLMMTLGGTMRVDPAELTQKIARQALLNPLVIATILGLCLRAVPACICRTPSTRCFAMLGGAAAPAALFVVGVSLAGRTIDKVPPELPVLIGIKLVVHPLIVYLLLSWVGDFDPVWVHAAVLMAALPPATGVIAYRPRVQVLRRMGDRRRAARHRHLDRDGDGRADPAGQGYPAGRSVSLKRDALPHGQTPQRRHAVEQEQAGAAQRLHRQEVGEQRPVERIDGGRAGEDIAAPGAVIGGEHARPRRGRRGRPASISASAVTSR